MRALPRLLRLALCLAAVAPATTAAAQQRGTAFYYAGPPPTELSVAFGRVVVDPAHVSDPAVIAHHGATPVAYLSIGEVSRTAPRHADIAGAWALGDNPAWDSRVMDVRHPGYRAFVLARVDALWQAGYRHLFLDTLDSYRIVAQGAQAQRAHAGALTSLLQTMVARHPGLRLLLNRGFELLPALATHVDAVVAESLFDRWDAGAGRYVRVPEADRRWLRGALTEVRARGIEAIVIDYRPPTQRAQAQATARAIAAEGFTPFVTDAALSTLGVGPVQVLPRRVLILSNQPAGQPDPSAAEPSQAAELLAPALEHMGLLPVGHDLAQGLPTAAALAGFAGVIAWLGPERAPPPGYEAWLLARLDSGVPLVLFGTPGVDLRGPLGQRLGLAPAGKPAAFATRPPAGQVVQRDRLIGFEADPPPRPLEVSAFSLRAHGAQVHLAVTDSFGRAGVAVATGPFGGLALSHLFALRGLSGQRAWVLDVEGFLEAALQLPPMPRPDLTTESGRRLAVLTLRAAGLAERAQLPGRPATSRVLLRSLLSRHPYPHTLEVADDSSGAERRAASGLARAAKLTLDDAALTASDADARPPQSSLTRLRSVLVPTALTGPPRPRAVRMPTASDLHYIGEAGHAHAYLRVLETLRYTDGGARRLTAIGLHYHAWMASTAGGLSALQDIYTWLDRQRPVAVGAAAFRLRAEAFAALVLTRDLSGGFGLHGGDALRTVRLPAGLAAPDPARSGGAIGWVALPQGRYVSLLPGPHRRLQPGDADAPPSPHLRDADVVIEAFEAHRDAAGTDIRIGWQATGGRAANLRLGGLPPGASCHVRGARPPGRVDAQGQLSLSPAQGAEALTLRCDAPGAPR